MSNNQLVNQLRLSKGMYITEICLDPISKTQFLACLHEFDTKEMVDGYSVGDIEEMIDFLHGILSEMRTMNTDLATPPLFTNEN